MQNYTYYLLVWALTSYCLILGDFSLKFGQTRSLCFTYCLRLASQLTTWYLCDILTDCTWNCTIMYQVHPLLFTHHRKKSTLLYLFTDFFFSKHYNTENTMKTFQLITLFVLIATSMAFAPNQAPQSKF